MGDLDGILAIFVVIFTTFGAAQGFWTAATLGSGTKIITNGDDAADSICPKGWRIPSRAGNDSWYKLIGTSYGIPSGANSTYSTNRIRKWPLNFMITGSYYSYSGTGMSGLITGRTNSGNWWSITGNGAGYVHILSSSSTWLSSAYRGEGQAIRCVVRS